MYNYVVFLLKNAQVHCIEMQASGRLGSIHHMYEYSMYVCTVQCTRNVRIGRTHTHTLHYSFALYE